MCCWSKAVSRAASSADIRSIINMCGIAVSMGLLRGAIKPVITRSFNSISWVACAAVGI